MTTAAVTAITTNRAVSGGEVTAEGGASVSARGVCWSKSAAPTIADSHTTDGTGKGTFSSSITGLSHRTVYHVRAYAVNSAGTAYGSDRAFTTEDFSVLYVGESGDCGTKTPCYATIQAAIDAANTGVTIKIGRGTFNGPITLNDKKILIFQGGWDAAYDQQTSNSTFIKAPKVPQGSLTFQEVTIRP